MEDEEPREFAIFSDDETGERDHTFVRPPRKIVSEEHMDELLKGCFQISDLDLIKKIPKLSYISYVERGEAPINERFCQGGFFNYFSSKDGEKNRLVFSLRYPTKKVLKSRKKSFNYIWCVYLENIEAVYIKPNFGETILLQKMIKITQKLKAQIETLSEKITALENRNSTATSQT